VRSKLKQFPEIVRTDVDLKAGRVYMQAKPTFDQYVALEHALEDAGGAIKMVHPTYRVPQALYATLGVRGRDPDKLMALEERLKAVPGVRSAIIDPDRWFTNEQGLDVGGVVVFADRAPQLELRLTEAAKRAGFLFEPKDHGEGAGDAEEWSEMNHAFAGLCLLFLTVLGMLNVGLARPPSFIRYGTVFVWLALFVFLFIRSDRGYWPLGPAPWWDGFREWDTLQHRLGMGVLLAIAAGDFLRLRNGWKFPPALSRWGLLAVGLGGSAMLFTHLHSTLDPAHQAMTVRMNAQHLAMATCALLFTLTKFAWDTWQRPRKWGPYLWLVCLGALGIVLNLYVE
jgi:hypothetical protein